MSYPPRIQSAHRASIASIASSTLDDYLPSAAFTYSYGPPPSSTGSISPPPSPILRSRTLSTSTNRSRARRLLLIGSPLPIARHESDAFGGQAYDDALEPDEEEGLEYELAEMDAEGTRGTRETFQLLTSEEKVWMGVSAGVVVALTALSCVLAAIS